MNTQKLLLLVGGFIFSSLGLLSFSQIHYVEKRGEALLFISVTAILYFLLVILFTKKKSFFFILLTAIATSSVVLVFLFSTIFSGHH